MKRSKIKYAVDIGNSSIKWITYRSSWKGIEILDARIQTLPQEYLLLRDEKEKIKVMAETLDSLLAGEGGHPRRDITVSLPADNTIVRYITLPNIPPSKIDKIIRFEAEQQIPLPFGDVEWSYTVLPLRKKREVDVVITAARKELVRQLTEVVSAHNFRIASFEPGQLMLADLVKMQGVEREGTIMLDLGARSIHVCMFCNGVLWGRTLRFGMFKITRRIAERLRVPMSEAEKRKIRCGLSPESASGTADAPDADISSEQKTVLKGVIEDVLYEVVNELSRTVSYYLSVMRGAVFNRIYLTGGGANITGIAPFIEKNLGVKTCVADLTKKIFPHPHLKDRFAYDKNYYSVVLGAASLDAVSRQLSTNLLSKDIREKREVRYFAKNYIIFFSLICAALLFLFASLRYECYVKQRNQHKLTKRFNVIEQAEARQREIEQEIHRDVDQLKIVEHNLDRREFFVKLFNAVEQALPENVWFESLSYEYAERRMVISGRTSGTLDDIHVFTHSVRALDFVKEVNFDAASIEEKDAQGAEERLFSLTVVWYGKEGQI